MGAEHVCDLLKRFKIRQAFGPTIENIQMLMNQIETIEQGGGLSLNTAGDDEEQKDYPEEEEDNGEPVI